MECKHEELKRKTEIVVARYDAVAGTWGATTTLTSNTALDRAPRISTASDGTALLTTPNPGPNEDEALLRKLGLEPEGCGGAAEAR